jgi:hypothetical protein
MKSTFVSSAGNIAIASLKNLRILRTALTATSLWRDATLWSTKGAELAHCRYA